MQEDADVWPFYSAIKHPNPAQLDCSGLLWEQQMEQRRWFFLRLPKLVGGAITEQDKRRRIAFPYLHRSSVSAQQAQPESVAKEFSELLRRWLFCAVVEQVKGSLVDIKCGSRATTGMPITCLRNPGSRRLRIGTQPLTVIQPTDRHFRSSFVYRLTRAMP